jgi:hypothetical protein
MKRGRNPGKGSFARCVKAVKRRGGVSDPNAVCAASKRRTKKGARELERASKAARRRNVVPLSLADVATVGQMLGVGKKGKKKSKRNPATEAAGAYQGFHGRPSDELVEVREQIHFHRHLAGAGKLEKLVVEVPRKLFRVTLKNFKGALLCFNEARSQLFIKGGDQAVDLRQFGIKEPHEIETLGLVRVVEYFTTKDHLGSEGGTATYVHKFHRPYPTLIYHTIDKRLEFAGGAYDVPDEGIDR